MKEYNMLTSSQKEVVFHTKGPLMVIAGPGTGKTFTLVKKIIYLLTQEKIDPESIFVTTFTRKAVNELRIRVAEELKENNLKIDVNRIKISTFHSFCIEILEQEKYIILDDFQQRYLIYKNLYQFKKIEGFNLVLSALKAGFKSKVLSLQQQFNKLSEHNISPEKLIGSTRREIGILGLLYDLYLQILKNNNCLDFSRIQIECLNLINKNLDNIEEYIPHYEYILVDEYQDTNSIQNEILFSMFSKMKNICVVGDDDQSIYRFRGATVKNILNFPNKFGIDEKVTIVKLETNYRSNDKIIKFYSNFIENYTWENRRYDKKISSSSEEISYKSILKVSGKTDEEWGNEVVDLIKTLKNKEIISDYSQIAFLGRSVKSKDVKYLIKTLNKNDILTYSPRSGNFFNLKEIKIIVGIALLLVKEYARGLYNENINYNLFTTYSYYRECIALIKTGEKSELKDIFEWLKNENYTEKDNFLPIFYKIFSFDYFKEILSKENIKNKTYEISERNLSIFANIVSEYEKKFGSIFKSDFFDFYLPFLQECGINEYEEENEITVKGHISFLTFHQSKGLEFPIVLAGSLEQSPFKSEKNSLEEILRENVYGINRAEFEKNEEEDFYRLYYTCFSRAKDYLFLTAKEVEMGKKTGYPSPSGYFKETFDNLVDWKKEILENIENLKKIGEPKDNFSKKLFSYTTDVALYLDCPMKYRFLRYGNFPKIETKKEHIGVLVHNTINDIHQNILKKRIVTKDSVKNIMAKNYKQLKNSLGINLELLEKKEAFEDVHFYIEKESESLLNIKDSELNLAVVREEYILNGILDLMRKNNHDYDIVDFKTSLVKSEEIPATYRKQLLVYGFLATESGYSIKNLELHYTSLREDIKQKFLYEEKEVKKVLEQFDDIVKKILNKDFFTTIKSEKKCENCQFFHYCN